jgi:hypothetical protein
MEYACQGIPWLQSKTKVTVGCAAAGAAAGCADASETSRSTTKAEYNLMLGRDFI